MVAASAVFSKFIQRTMFSTGKYSIAVADGPAVTEKISERVNLHAVWPPQARYFLCRSFPKKA